MRFCFSSEARKKRICGDERHAVVFFSSSRRASIHHLRRKKRVPFFFSALAIAIAMKRLYHDDEIEIEAEKGEEFWKLVSSRAL